MREGTRARPHAEVIQNDLKELKEFKLLLGCAYVTRQLAANTLNKYTGLGQCSSKSNLINRETLQPHV